MYLGKMMSPKDEFLESLKKLNKNTQTPKQWAKDILANPNYTLAIGIQFAKDALNNKGRAR
nr:hypothetical protein [uncultured bacterium]|tara:strand:- start:175 stop:357 length:183 start_codon:yes stop_codon:yes gene_type:complete